MRRFVFASAFESTRSLLALVIAAIAVAAARVPRRPSARPFLRGLLRRGEFAQPHLRELLRSDSRGRSPLRLQSVSSDLFRPQSSRPGGGRAGALCPSFQVPCSGVEPVGRLAQHELRAAEQRQRLPDRVGHGRVPELGRPPAVHHARLASIVPSRALPRKFVFSSIVVKPVAPSGRLKTHP